MKKITYEIRLEFEDFDRAILERLWWIGRLLKRTVYTGVFGLQWVRLEYAKVDENGKVSL